MKMPEPIIEPTTIIVPSNNPMARMNPGSSFLVRITAGAQFQPSARRSFPRGLAAGGINCRYCRTRSAGFFAFSMSLMIAMRVRARINHFARAFQVIRRWPRSACWLTF